MRAASCRRVIGGIGLTKDFDGSLLLGEMQTSNLPGLKFEHDPTRTSTRSSHPFLLVGVP